MPNFINNVVTAQGASQIAAAVAGIQLVITRVQVGSGVATGNISNLTALVSPVMNLTPQPPQTSANNLQPGEMEVMATLDTANVGATFSLAEMGVWAKSGGGPEQLICYLQCSTPYDSINHQTGGSRLQINVQIPIIVGVGASVSITVQAGNPVFVPPVVAGPGIVVTAPTDASGHVTQWIVSTPQITNSTTLFVKAGNNNVAPNFSTLQNAMNYLQGFTIASGIQVTISIAEGQYLSNQTFVGHTNGQQIVITGKQNPDVTASGVSAITGGNGNWNVTYSGVSSTANIRAGTWINVYNVGGLANGVNTLLCGFFPVVSVSGSSVTVTNPMHMASWPSTAGVASISITPITTVLFNSTAAPTTGYNTYIGVQGCGTIAYLGFVCNVAAPNWLATNGLVITGATSISRCGAWGYANNTGYMAGFNASGAAARVTMICCGSTQNSAGYIASGGAQIIQQYCPSSHNYVFGAWCQGGGNLLSYQGLCQYGGNGRVYPGGAGILAQTNSTVTCQGYYDAAGNETSGGWIVAWSGGTAGLYLNQTSALTVSTSTDYMWMISNANYDVAMTGLCTASLASVIGSTIYNFTKGVLSPSGCWGA